MIDQTFLLESKCCSCFKEFEVEELRNIIPLPFKKTWKYPSFANLITNKEDERVTSILCSNCIETGKPFYAIEYSDDEIIYHQLEKLEPLELIKDENKGFKENNYLDNGTKSDLFISVISALGEILEPKNELYRIENAFVLDCGNGNIEYYASIWEMIAIKSKEKYESNPFRYISTFQHAK